MTMTDTLIYRTHLPINLQRFFCKYLLLEILTERPTVCRPFRRQMTGLVLNVSFWPELEHEMAFVYARKDDVAVASF